MSRLVHRLSRPSKGYTGLQQVGDEDGYLGRVAKYVPSEIVALYLPLIKFIESSGATEAKSLRLWLYGTSFLVFVVLTPIYFTKLAKPDDGLRVQRVVSTIAFVFWAYSLGGIFSELGIQNDLIAGVSLILFAAISGAIKPYK